MNTIPNARQFAVLGLGRFGSALARQLYALGKEVLAVDTDEQKVDDIAEYVTHAMAVDCLDEPAMRQIGLENFDVVIVGVGEMETSILATLICKEIGVKYVVAKAQSVQHRKVLEKIGADMVVFPEMEAGCKLGNLLASPTVVELAEIAPNFKVVEVEVPSVWADKSLTELKIRQIPAHRADGQPRRQDNDFTVGRIYFAGKRQDSALRRTQRPGQVFKNSVIR